MDYDEYCPCLGEKFSAEMREKLHRQARGITRRPKTEKKEGTLWSETKEG